MTIPTKVRLIYDVEAEGFHTPAEMSTALGAIPLPCGPIGGVPPDLSLIGCSSVLADSTTTTGGGARRTIDISILPLVTIFTAVNPQTMPYAGSIVSSNPADSQFGTGLQQIELSYKDLAGKVFGETAPLNGTTPQKLAKANKANVYQTRPRYGTGGTNAGLVALLNDQGNLVLLVNGPWQGSIVSSRDEDNAAGIGAQQIQVQFVDQSLAPGSETVNLTGKVPANLASTNKKNLTALSIATAGSFSYNVGILSVFSGLNGTGALMAQIQLSFFSNFPPTYLKTVDVDGTPLLTPTEVAADQTCPFVDLYTHILAANIGSPVTPHAPMLLP